MTYIPTKRLTSQLHGHGSEVEFISITSVLSWMAFGKSMSSNELWAHLDIDVEIVADERRMAFNYSLNEFISAAVQGKIVVRGKYARNHASYGGDHETRTINKGRFHDFCKYDPRYEGLRRGKDLSWAYESKGLDTSNMIGVGDLYYDLLVSRNQLISAVNCIKDGDDLPEKKPKGARASTYKRHHMPPGEEILTQCLKMKAEGMDRDTIAETIHSIEGFEAVGADYARSIMSGHLGRGRPKVTRR
jgi:hypothetical protein